MSDDYTHGDNVADHDYVIAANKEVFCSGRLEECGARTQDEYLAGDCPTCKPSRIALLEEVVEAARLWRRCGFAVTQGDAICDALTKLEKET